MKNTKYTKYTKGDAMVWIIIIVVIVLLAGILLMRSNRQASVYQPTTSPDTTVTPGEQSDADLEAEINSMGSELNQVDVNGVDDGALK